MPKRISLTQQLERAKRAAIASRAYFEVWFVLKEEKSRAEHLDAMNKYSAFFAPVIEALFAACIIDLYALTESDPNTVNLMTTWNAVRREHVIPDLEARVVDDLIERTRDAARPIRILRHQYVAHKTATISHEDVFRLAGVTPNEIRRLIGEAIEAVALMMKFAGRSEIADGQPMAAHTNQLLRDVAKYHGL